jgi:hypothetical protein
MSFGSLPEAGGRRSLRERWWRPFEFWRNLEARFETRFRVLPAPKKINDLHANHSEVAPADHIAALGDVLILRIHNADCPLDAVYSDARYLAHVGAWVVDGQYISRWIIGGGLPDALARQALEDRFRADAALAAKACGLVRAHASEDEAVDAWLDLLARAGSP